MLHNLTSAFARPLLLLSCISFVSAFSHAQSINDSLTNVVDTTTNYERKLVALSDMVRFNYDTDTAFAMQAARRFLATADQARDTSEMARGYNLMGIVKRYNGKVDQAVGHYYQSLRMYEALDESYMVAMLHNNIADLQGSVEKFEEAEKSYQKAYEIFTEQGDRRWQINTLFNLVTQFNKQGRYLDSKPLLEKAAEFGATSDSLGLQFEYYARLGGTYSAEGDSLEAAKSSYERALTHLDAANRPADAMFLYNNLAELEATTKNFESAIEYVIKAEKAEQSVQSPDHDMRYYKSRYDIYNAIGNNEKALVNLEAYIMLKDSAFTAKTDERIVDAEKKYETEKKDQAIAFQQTLLQRKSTEFKWILAGSILLVLLLFYTLYLARERKKNSIKVVRQKNELEKTLSERDLLLKEIHHRVKNNLQIVSSLLSLQSREIADEKALEAVNESRNRVKSMALIHQNLYTEDNLVGIDMQAYLQKLSNNLQQNYRSLNGEIQLETDIENMVLDVDTTIPIGLIVNELLMNALKHAFPNQQDGTIKVKLMFEDEHLALEVSDNGVGITNNTPAEESTNFGTKMIKTFAQKLNAEYSIAHQKGTQVRLVIRKFKIAA